MKKLITLFIVSSFFSCNDGNFDIPSFEFTDEVKNCGEYILYVTNSNSTEALVLVLDNTQIGNTVGDASYAISTTLKVNYRIFDEGIGTDYFCQDIPPSIPKVLKDLDAESGSLNISTAEILTDDVVTGYTYTITFSELLFSDVDERIFFESLNFGVFTVNL